MTHMYACHNSCKNTKNDEKHQNDEKSWKTMKNHWCLTHCLFYEFPTNVGYVDKWSSKVVKKGLKMMKIWCYVVLHEIHTCTHMYTHVHTCITSKIYINDHVRQMWHNTKIDPKWWKLTQNDEISVFYAISNTVF